MFEGTQTPQAVHEVVAAVGSSLSTKGDLNLQNTSNLDDEGSIPEENKLERLTKAWIREYCVADSEAITSKGDM